MTEICNECGESVAAGSGNFVNRVPDFNSVEERRENGRPFPEGDFMCAKCDSKIRMKTLYVTLYFTKAVTYEIDVPEINAEEIRNALLKKDGSEWATEPNFFEFLGMNYRKTVLDTSDEDLLKNTTERK